MLRAPGRRRGRHVDVHVRDREDSASPRATVVAGKRVGSAVHRNRAKRRLRAAIRQAGVPVGRDVVLVAKPGAEGVDFDELCGEVATASEPVAGRAHRG